MYILNEIFYLNHIFLYIYIRFHLKSDVTTFVKDVPKYKPKRCELIKQNVFIFNEQSKALPADFAQQILNNDIIFVLSEYSNNDALKNLIQLYMTGVEHYKEHEDRAHEYFAIKLKNIFTNPVILQSNQSTREQTKQSTPSKSTNKKIQIPPNSNPIQTYSFLNRPPLTSKKAPENNILSFSFQEASISSVDKFFACSQIKPFNNTSQLIGKNPNQSDSSKSDGAQINWDEDQDASEKKNSVKDEKIQQIQEQVQEDQYILQEQAKLMAAQSKKQERRISQQIEADKQAQQQSVIKRQEMRKMRSQFSMHNINKAQSTPTMKLADQFRTPEQNTNCIPEEPGEIGSSKLPSTSKKVEINQFSFNEESK